MKPFGANLTILGKKKSFVPSTRPAGIAGELCCDGWGCPGVCWAHSGNGIKLWYHRIELS